MTLISAYKTDSDIDGNRLSSANDVDKMTKRVDNLFDSTICSCTILTCQEADCKGCNSCAHINCCCAREVKIPAIELGFIGSQLLKSGELGWRGRTFRQTVRDLSDDQYILLIQNGQSHPVWCPAV